MDIYEAAANYKAAIEALHTRHASTDVHNHGGVAGAAITEHCALLWIITGDRCDPKTNSVIS